MTKDEIIKALRDMAKYPTVTLPRDCEALRAAADLLEQPAPVQEPMAIDGNTSDGYHTFNELYEFRKAYNAALFNEWAAGGKCSVHKSWRHHDGELCFGGGWFIVVAVLPQGQISNHYEAKDWGLFSAPETERALFEFDGHTGADVIERLNSYTPPQRTKQEPVAWCVTYNGELTGNIFENLRIADLCKRNLEAKYGSEESREVVPIYTTPPQRTWVGLTDEEMQECIKTADYNQGQYKRTLYWAHLSTAIEAKLKAKNFA